ncbi:MAG TPA: hypothetical protein VHD56_05005 [Tepidisphaeraceae bacterium]|nr:hypothetical protein [Tepidisphaeraceae bacterium]
MLNVFITIDTEAWPSKNWREAGLQPDFDLDVYGKTSDGEFGVGYQMDVLDAHQLKAVFFIEALSAPIVGMDRLRQLVQFIQGRGHEVQLHVHSEWLEWLNPSPLPGRTGQNLKDFSLDEQARLVAAGLGNLQACGATDVCAFRAGNYGANLDTLAALARHGIRYDTSHNTCYLESDCGMKDAGILLQPKQINGVCEIPISFFEDWPGHYRHAQLCACSAAEMENALMQAWRAGWFSFVLVSHGFELIRDRKHPLRPARSDSTVVRRFHRVCEFLNHNRDKFRTSGFSDLDPAAIPHIDAARPLRSRIGRTVKRVGEQLLRRI